MTPIYRSPDHDQTQAMQTLLLDHQIQTSVIETRKTNNSSGSSSVTWYELWLRNYADIARAKSIITQHEFTTFKTNMSSYRTSVQTQQKVKFHSTVETIAVETIAVTDTKNSGQDIALKEIPAPVKSILDQDATKPREDLIPINNKRVFRRLGHLLGFSDEEINKFDNQNNKLYRPWDAAELMERVKNLKQKCS